MSLTSSIDRFDALNSNLEESVKRAESIADAFVGTMPEVAEGRDSAPIPQYSLLSGLDGRLDRNTDLGIRLRIALSHIDEGLRGSDKIGGGASKLVGMTDERARQGF